MTLDMLATVVFWTLMLGIFAGVIAARIYMDWRDK